MNPWVERPRMRTIWIAPLCALLLATPARAWHQDTHRMVVRLAPGVAGEALPAFFREGRAALEGAVSDPDLFCERVQPELRSAERPEHYFDVELIAGHPVPATRYEALALCARLRVNPWELGFLPYAITEWSGRLAWAFAQHRARPDDPAVRAKCLLYAGILAHYTADLAQPLHITIHYDGRVGAGGKSPRSGIHQTIDALPGLAGLTGEEVEAGLAPAAVEAVMPFVLAELERSHALVDRVYELEPLLPAAEAKAPLDPAVRAFALDRARAAVAFTAAIYRAAWELSAKLELPAWLGPAP